MRLNISDFVHNISKTKATYLTCILLFSLGLNINLSCADVLVINDVITSDDRPDLPQNGLTQAAVREQFGEPQVQHEAVGDDPPITRWDYPGYSVFFEHNLVITAVVKPELAKKQREAENN